MLRKKPTKALSKSDKLLAPYNMSLVEYEQYRLGAVNNVLKHIDYLQRQIDEYRTLAERIQVLTPGDLFIWNYKSRWAKKVSPAIIRFNCVNESNQLSVSILACDISCFFHHKHMGYSTSENYAVEINDVKNWTPITAKDLPLYLNMEKRYPLFDEILKGTP